jgi:hypothetical protein
MHDYSASHAPTPYRINANSSDGEFSSVGAHSEATSYGGE